MDVVDETEALQRFFEGKKNISKIIHVRVCMCTCLCVCVCVDTVKYYLITDFKILHRFHYFHYFHSL